MTKTFSFNSFSKLLNQAGALIGAAELHGIQTGLFCGKQDDADFDWLSILLEELDCGTDKRDEVVENLKHSYMTTLKQLQSISFSFQPLLPDDTDNICVRTLALSDWCRGFLCGLGLAGITEDYVKGLTKEAIEDLSKIAHVEAEDDETEIQEEAYSDLVEYIRVSIHIIQLELHKKKDNAGFVQSTTLH